MGSAPRMTGRWRPLPASLAPEIAYLVGVLRELKDRSSLSLAALATRTAYSKSSWERYLNGTTLPPRHAVEALGRLAGEPAGRLLALWERAEAQWSGRAAEPRQTATVLAAGSEPGAPPPRRHPRSRGWAFAALAACATAAVLAALARPLDILGASAHSPSTAPPAYTVGCHGTQCAGGEPEGMACAIDAASFADLRLGHTYVELRISDQCGAAWARVSHPAVGDRVLVVDQDGRSEAVTIPDDAATEQYVPTRMIAADRHSHVRACVESGDGERQCTPWGASRPVPVPPPTRPPSPSVSSSG
jgi:hypothetical protein